jgi:predicted transcriptional regulator
MDFEFELKQETYEQLEEFTQLLNKDANVILNEALQQYFENEYKKILEKDMDSENAMTNLDYDEFWDGVDL